MNPQQTATISACAGKIFTRLVRAEHECERWILTDLTRDNRLQQWTRPTKEQALEALIDAGLIYQDESEAYVPHEACFELRKDEVTALIRDRLSNPFVRVA